MQIFDAYAILRKGGDLRPDLVEELIQGHQQISAPQWASLVAFLGSKKATESEQALLAWIFQQKPWCRDLIRVDRGEMIGDEQERRFLRALNRREELGEDSIRWWISGVTSNALPPEHIAFFLGKITCLGMHAHDIRRMIRAMVDFGHVYDYRNLRELEFRKIIRRYPSGALSEKGALVLPALIAAIREFFPAATSFLVARSLSFTGGTWDKLASIPGFQFPAPGAASIHAMQRCGVAMTVTHHDANPADRILYQMRSQTGTVECEALIIASIVSKQLTFPPDVVLLDMRYGPGAFFPDSTTASHTGATMAQILRDEGVAASYTLTEAAVPTGSAIGNALEIIEALVLLKGVPQAAWNLSGLDRQRAIVLRLFSILLHETFPHISEEEFFRLGEEMLYNGRALRSFLDILSCHGVQPSVLDALLVDPWGVMLPGLCPVPIYSPHSGVLSSIDQRALGNLVNFSLSRMEDGGMDRRAGIKLNKLPKEAVHCDEPLAWVFTTTSLESYRDDVLSCFEVQ